MANRTKRGTPPPKVALNAENFDRLVEDHGTYCRVTPSIVCPRRSGARVELDDTNHDLNCQLCFGSLTIDLDDLAFETWIFIQGIKLEKMFNAQGIYDVKDCFASFKPGIRVSYWYKIEMLDLATQYNEIVMRGRGTEIDKLRYPAIVDEATGNIFHVVDNDGTPFVRGDDYEVESGSRDIVWGNKAPVEGKLYSILYPILPTFRVLELMHEQRNYYEDEKRPDRVPIQMPQQAHIRWDFNAKRQGSDRERSQSDQ